jgi:hypothetical protein
MVAGQDDSVRFDIRTPSADGTAHLRASVGAFTQDVPITFRKARPERIIVDAGVLTAKPSDVINVNAHLLRAVGTVTAGTPIVFSAADSTGATVGAWVSSLPSNPSGVAQGKFGAPGLSSGRTVTLTASTIDGTVTGSTKVVIAP